MADAEKKSTVVVNKKGLNKPQVFVFYIILYWDKFKDWLFKTRAAKRLHRIKSKIRDLIRWYLKHPDDYFEHKWHKNEFYPFKKDEHDQFVCFIRVRWFYPVLIIFIASICYTAIRAYFYNQINEFMAHLVIIVTGLTVLILWQKQQLIIDLDEEVYVIIWYNTILCTDQIHNLFLRILEFRGSPADKPYYQLILQASQLPAVSITRLSRDAERIRRIGHMIAEKLNINFFEHEDISHNHIVRHWPILPVGEDITSISPPPKTDFFPSKTMKALFNASADLAQTTAYEFEKLVVGKQDSVDKLPTDTTTRQKPREVIEQIKRTSNDSGKAETEEPRHLGRRFLRRRKPLSFFKSIFPHDKRRKNIPTDEDLATAGPSAARIPSSQRIRKNPILTPSSPMVSTSEDSDDQNGSPPRNLKPKSKFGQSAESCDSVAFNSLLSILSEELELKSTESESDEREDKEKDFDRI